MSAPETVPAATGTLDVPGAGLYYEVRGEGPPLVLVGAPMDATAFAPVADALAGDHTVITTDPRGIHRSRLDDPQGPSTPDLRADDLARLLVHLGAGPATVFGSSGGAVTALALAQNHPGRVHTVVAHEPPLHELLEDRDERRAATDAVIAAYLDQGPEVAWGLFLADAGLLEEMDGEAPGPEDRGQQTERDPREIIEERRFFLHELRPTTRWVPDLDTLQAVQTRLVVGIGEQSRGQICERTSLALADALGLAPRWFPGGHGGFVEEPEGFAKRLRAVLHDG